MEKKNNKKGGFEMNTSAFVKTFSGKNNYPGYHSFIFS